MTTPEPDHSADPAQSLAQRRGPDLITLIAGLVTLSIAGSALIGGLDWLPAMDSRWVLAAVAMLVGVLLVLGSIRRPRRP